METNPQKSSSSKKKRLDVYAKYSAMAFQMAVIIFGLTYAGIKLDSHFKSSFPAFTIFLALLSVVIAIYFAVKDLLKK